MKIRAKVVNFFLLTGIACVILGNVKTSAADKLNPVDLRNVKVGGEIGSRIDLTVQNNLLVLDIDNDFLRPFQEKTALRGYIGLGKTIDAAVRFAAYTNDSRVIAIKNHIVSETIKAQQSDGYIGMMLPASRLWTLWDIHEMVYIIYGLVSDYRYFKEEKSLKAAQKAADYIIERWHDRPKDYPSAIHMVMANTGIDRAFPALSEAAGSFRYRQFCIDKLGLADWDLDIALGRHSLIEGHAYAYIARCLAQLELYRIQPDQKLLGQTQRTIDFLTKGNGMVITGACGYHECWHDNQHGFFKLGETCATAYLIRLLDNILRLSGDSRYGDLMERSIYNALFAAQSPDGRRIRYYSPFEGERVYFDRDTYCCPCNFRRIIAELPGMIYYRSGSGAAINLYTSSTADIKLDDGVSLSVRQETDYPNSGEVVIHLNPSTPAKFPLRLRIPSWCTEGTMVFVNGIPIEKSIDGGAFFTVERQWKAGDRIKMNMPMNWRAVKGRKAQAGRFAVMRGPVLFCLNPELNSKLEAEDLKLLRLDPVFPGEPEICTAVRHDGLACRMKAWNPNSYLGEADIELVLTEFADPGGQWTYFLMPNPKADVYTDDELLGQSPTNEK